MIVIKVGKLTLNLDIEPPQDAEMAERLRRTLAELPAFMVIWAFQQWVALAAELPPLSFSGPC